MNKALFLLFFPGVAFSQNDFSLEITFSTHTNDHVNKTFHSTERHWTVNGNSLYYHIDAHDKRYTDTLELTDDELGTILQKIEEEELFTPVKRDLGQKGKIDMTSRVICRIQIAEKVVDITVQAHAPSLIEEDDIATKLSDVEQLMHEIIDRHR